jgi:8-oxo-dGTP diphosphatase
MDFIHYPPYVAGSRAKATVPMTRSHQVLRSIGIAELKTSSRGPHRAESDRCMTRIRVAALAARGDEILLARHIKDGLTSYLLPGGGLDDDENAHVALARELREEASAVGDIGDLRYVVEVLAPDRSRHLIQLVFDVFIDGAIGDSSDPRVARCEWHPVAALRTLPIHPAIGAMIADDLARANQSQCRYVLAEWVEKKRAD